MNSLQRVVATVANEQRDRPPVIPVMLMQPAKLLNISLQEYQQKGELLAKGQLKLLEELEHDAVFGFPHVVQDVTPWGAGLITFAEGPPSVSKMCITNFADIDQLLVPDPYSSPVLKETLKAISLLKKELQNNYPVIGAAIAPFSLPSMLMGTEKFLSLLLDDPQVREKYFPKLMEMMVKYVADWCNMQVEAGADMIVLADGIASGTVIRRNQFEVYAYPYVKKVIGKIKAPVIYESVGSGVGIIDLIDQAGAAVMLLDHSDQLDVARANLPGSKMAIMGNINNIASLKWSKLKMQIEVRNAMHAMGDHPYIVSMQGPEVPYHMPLELIKEMIATVKKYGIFGNYKSNPEKAFR